VNNYRYAFNPVDGFINIPLQIAFDNEGREDGINIFQENIIEQVINDIDDFETTKFANAQYLPGSDSTDINYEFYFYNQTVPISGATTIDWSLGYKNTDFTDDEVYYFSNAFKGSFFKLDFYDTKNNENQKAYFSVILPTQQGEKQSGFIGPTLNPTQVNIQTPKFILDYVGANKEGFFIYWLKEKTFIDINEFYMTAKFFNAKKGQFIRMMNQPQSLISTANRFNFDKSTYFYYKVILDYTNYEYSVYSETQQNNQTITLQRIGNTLNPIKWYEYVNP
jgi:hypothetical protein